MDQALLITNHSCNKKDNVCVFRRLRFGAKIRKLLESLFACSTHRILEFRCPGYIYTVI